MKLKKLTYFPYLPNSRIEDNKRYKYIRDMMEKNPFSYHRKKNIFSNFNENPNSNIDNIKENDQNNKFLINDQENESLIFHNNHDKYMNLYNNFMQRKTSTIEAHAQNYLNFLIKLKKPFQINNTPNKNISNKILITSRNNNNFQSLSPINNNSSPINFFNNNTISLSNEIRGRKHFLKEKTTPSESNIFSQNNNKNSTENETQNENFIAGKINSKHTDITNPFFYNGIAKEIIRMNQETMDYNRKESEKIYQKKKKNLRYYENDLPLSPEKINNPNYYNIGDSSLEINPIINRGNYSLSYSRNYKGFNRQKSNFY